MRKKLPILISVPHGGQDIPSECRSLTKLSPLDIFIDSDGFTREIYSFRERVEVFKDTGIARAFVDLNRRRDDLAPANPDGVIKTETVPGVPVYKADRFPTPGFIEDLLNKYYDPYHRYLNDTMMQKKVVMALDCHSMLEFAPQSSPNPGRRRPTICISNAGDDEGKPISNDVPLTCTPTLLSGFARILAESFDIPKAEVRMNDPFTGGAIIRNHATKGIPWIQFELNRSLYLTSKSFDEKTLWCDPKQLQEIREKIWSAVVQLLTFID